MYEYSAGVSVLWCSGQRTTFGNWFSLSIWLCRCVSRFSAMFCTTGLGHLASRSSPVSASHLPGGVRGLQMYARVPGFLVLCIPGITLRSPGLCDELSHLLGHLSNPQEWALPSVIIPDKFQNQTCSQGGLDFLAGSICLHLTLTPDTKVPRKSNSFLPRRWSIFLPLIELLSPSMSVWTHSSCLCLAGRFRYDLLSPWPLQSHCSFQRRGVLETKLEEEEGRRGAKRKERERDVKENS